MPRTLSTSRTGAPCQRSNRACDDSRLSQSLMMVAGLVCRDPAATPVWGIGRIGHPDGFQHGDEGRAVAGMTSFLERRERISAD